MTISPPPSPTSPTFPTFPTSPASTQTNALLASTSAIDQATQLRLLQIEKDRKDWAASAPHGDGESRDIALLRIENCETHQTELLDLTYLNLSSVPPHIPAHVVKLYLDSNQLISLAATVVPEGLQILSVANNPNLTTLPALPQGLITLHATGCQLFRLPPDSPPTLQHLMLSRNAALTVSAEDSLPHTLQTLRLSHCNIDYFPDNVMPPFLDALMLDGNRLRRLPEMLPSHLRRLMVQDNQLANLPESLASLPSSTVIDISGNPLSARTREAIERIAGDASWAGPCIIFSADHAGYATPQRALEEIVAFWYCPDQSVQMATAWRDLASQPQARDFFSFLSRLTYTANIKEAQFVSGIGHLLEHLLETPDLRQQLYLLAEEATQSCSDRLLQVLSDMENACIVHTIEQGEYDEQLPLLIQMGRKMFRKDCLQLIAQNKVQSLFFVDEVEVYLAYQVQLQDALELGSIVRQMKHFNISNIGQQDLDLASERVRQSENTEFLSWMINWSPWNSVLQRLDQLAYRQSQQAIEAEDVFESRLRTQLAAENIAPSLETETIMGSRVMQQMTLEAKLALTRHFLAQRGLTSLLTSPWEGTGMHAPS